MPPDDKLMGIDEADQDAGERGIPQPAPTTRRAAGGTGPEATA
jgi:hypothetical protein